MILPTFEDAWKKRWRAEESLKKRDWAEAIFHAQECIDLSVKAFLQTLRIEYEPKHELTDQYFRRALNKLESKSKPELIRVSEPRIVPYTFVDKKILSEPEVKLARILLAKAKVWMDLLAKIRSYAEGYAPLNVAARDVFDYSFEGFTRSAVEVVSSIQANLENLARRLGLQPS